MNVSRSAKPPRWNSSKEIAMRRSIVTAALLAVLAGGACQAQPSREEGVRQPVVAGRFYPAGARELRTVVDRCLRLSPAFKTPDPIALISPHAGLEYSGACAACGYSTLRGTRFARVMILGPSHYGGFTGAALPEYATFRTPLGDVPVDTAAIASLREHSLFGVHPASDRYEHSIEVQVPFLQQVLPPFKILPILVGSVRAKDSRRIAEALRPFAGEGTLLVASSDFTHFGPRFDFTPFRRDVRGRIQELDFGAIGFIVRTERTGFDEYVRRTGATICGRNPVGILLELLRLEAGARPVPAALLSYRTSADITGATADAYLLRQGSVSYASLAFFKPGSTKGGDTVEPRDLLPHDQPLEPADRAALLALARSTIERFLSGERHRDPAVYVDLENLPAAAKFMAGAFVTLKRAGNLRGCIGAIYPRQPLWKAVVENAIHAAWNDRRFAHVEKAELPELSVEISVLTPPREIPSPEGFEVGRHGIICEKEGRRAVFLPQVAPEQGWDREETLNHLARKAGLAPDAWREGARFWVFEAQVFGEEKT
jgi:AmmeMemoRadiSam system protein B/AmmeMemoRadiSam system protein A